MKLCICSDSHGNVRGLQEMIEREDPNMVCFLGDGERDWTHVNLPQNIQFAAVCGNCDFMAMEPTFRRMTLCGKQIFMTHGHMYGVKQGLYGLVRTLKDFPADLILYGHTHKAKLEEIGGCSFLNPGAMIDGRYAVITLDRDSGEMQIELKQL